MFPVFLKRMGYMEYKDTQKNLAKLKGFRKNIYLCNQLGVLGTLLG